MTNPTPREATPTTAVLYVRVSSKDQEREGYSIPAQRKLLGEYAAAEGIRILKVFEDVETAKRAGRTGFAEMVRFLRGAGDRCRTVLVEKTDRLYRNFRDYVTLDDLGLEIHLVKEGAVLCEDSRSSEKFIHGIKVLMAKNYIDNLSEETRKGMREKAEQGVYPSYAPLGYRNAKEANGKRTIEPDPDTAPIVARLYERYATGDYSLKEVAAMARDDGLAYRKAGGTVPTSTVHVILRNPLYMGDFEWAGRLYHGVHEPIVTRETWERVQAILDRRRQRRPRKVRHDFAYARLITCGHCGCALVGEIKKGKYVYYHCTGAKGKCPEPFVREEVLDEAFADLLGCLKLGDEETVGLMKESLQQSHEDEQRFHAETVARLQAQATKLQHRIEAMYEDKLDGRIDAEFFDRKTAEWRREQARIRERIVAHERADQNYLELGALLLDLANRARELFLMQSGGEKGRFLRILLSNCSWKEGRLDAQFRQAFALLADTTREARRLELRGTGTEGLHPVWLPD